MSDNEKGWVKVASSADLGAGDVLGVVAAGHEVCLYNLDGTICATDDICSHAYAKLSDGWLDNGEIECPLHAGRFDVRTGKATCPPCIDDIKVHQVRVRGEDIEIKLS